MNRNGDKWLGKAARIVAIAVGGSILLGGIGSCSWTMIAWAQDVKSKLEAAADHASIVKKHKEDIEAQRVERHHIRVQLKSILSEVKKP